MTGAIKQAENQSISDDAEAVVADILGTPGKNPNDVRHNFKCNGGILRIHKGRANSAFVYTHQHGSGASNNQPCQLEQDAVFYCSDFIGVRYVLKQGKNYVVNA